jgi:hypothetical protein
MDRNASEPQATVCPTCCPRAVGRLGFCARHDPLRPEPRRLRRAMWSASGFRRMQQAYKRGQWPEATPANALDLFTALAADGVELVRSALAWVLSALRQPRDAGHLRAHGLGRDPTVLRSSTLVSAQGPPAAPPALVPGPGGRLT